MEILVTGGFGNVGRSAVKACIAAGHEVTILESPQAMAKADPELRRMLRSPWRNCRILFGDLRRLETLRNLFSSFDKGPDAIIHLAALIPPAADRTRENSGGERRSERKPHRRFASRFPSPRDSYWLPALQRMGTGSRDF